MKLKPNEIEREIDESIADGQALNGQSTRTEIRLRKSPASRSGYNASKRDRSSRRTGEKKEEESTL
jgi:hypothetical protein